MWWCCGYFRREEHIDGRYGGEIITTGRLLCRKYGAGGVMSVLCPSFRALKEGGAGYGSMFGNFSP